MYRINSTMLYCTVSFDTKRILIMPLFHCIILMSLFRCVCVYWTFGCLDCSSAWISAFILAPLSLVHWSSDWSCGHLVPYMQPLSKASQRLCCILPLLLPHVSDQVTFWSQRRRCSFESFQITLGQFSLCPQNLSNPQLILIEPSYMNVWFPISSVTDFL